MTSFRQAILNALREVTGQSPSQDNSNASNSDRIHGKTQTTTRHTRSHVSSFVPSRSSMQTGSRRRKPTAVTAFLEWHDSQPSDPIEVKPARAAQTIRASLYHGRLTRTLAQRQ